ncbi:hypothetical protein Purlil1_12421 [Purpureocillium lilacinum]|uniref:DUF1774-domain-containing protein n=1 Tax=Purpureocillium lilacinum TaxID=33203 RepID=A0ABR0BGX7_PURLI|nr:hypothetical protein Purlil1_12421 [Purpureocillium lilacinum]
MGHFRHLGLFRRRESHSWAGVTLAKTLSVASWLGSVIVSVYCGTRGTPNDTVQSQNPWALNYAHPSSFTINSTLGYIFWSSLLNWQVLFIAQLFTRDGDRVREALNVCLYFIANNTLHATFVLLFVHSYFQLAEAALALNFVNLSVLHFRHNALSLPIQLSTISFPLSWTFFALYWNGFMMVPNQSLTAARVVGCILIWALLGYGVLSLAAFRDPASSLCLSFISVAVGVGQMERLASTPELVSPFVIGLLLGFATLLQFRVAWLGGHSGGPAKTETLVEGKGLSA